MHSQTINTIIYIIYSYFNHNYIFVAYLLGFVLSIGLCIYRPSRFLLFCMIGFGMLCFAFEYDKHFSLQVSNELVKTIMAKGQNISSTKFNAFIEGVLPILFYTIGWLNIFIAMIYVVLQQSPRSKDMVQRVI